MAIVDSTPMQNARTKGGELHSADASKAQRFGRLPGAGLALAVDSGVTGFASALAIFTASPVWVEFERAVDEPVGWREAGFDLHAIAEIAANNNWFQCDLVFGVERRDPHALSAENERGQRNGQRVRIGWNVEVDFCKGAGPSFPPGLSACSSIRAVREFSASAFDVDTSSASKVSFWPGKCSVALMPGASSPRPDSTDEAADLPRQAITPNFAIRALDAPVPA